MIDYGKIIKYQDWRSDIINNTCSIEHSFEFVYMVQSNGTYKIKRQCIKCGEHDGKAYKHSEISDLKYKIKVGLIKEFNPKLGVADYELFYQIQQKQIQEQKDNIVNEKEQWRKEHQEYLKSPKWKNIRQKVLRRDNFICQGCLENQATEVHHLTYKHWKDELMFELISICRTCHEKEHNV